MSNSENRRSADGNENDPRRQILRSERGWRELLRRSEIETEKFLKFYVAALREHDDEKEIDDDYDRLDSCAVAMGWFLGSKSDAAEDDEGNDAAQQPAADFPAVYSLHNLPECIAVSALFRFAKTAYAKFWKLRSGDVSPENAATLIDTLDSAQRDMMLAIDAENAMEFGLAICLMKKAHAALNRHFAEMKNLPAFPASKNHTLCARELRSALLDLRDICLRIIRDSRAEIENRTK